MASMHEVNVGKNSMNSTILLMCARQINNHLWALLMKAAKRTLREDRTPEPMTYSQTQCQNKQIM